MITAPVTLPAPSVQTDPRLIYVVDDELMIGEVVETILKLEGFDARFFQNPVPALEALREEQIKPALLLTDFVMQPMDGMSLIEKAKAFLPDLKTILYSGNVGEEIIAGRAVAPDSFLPKPFLPKHLIGMVRTLLSQRPNAPAAPAKVRI